MRQDNKIKTKFSRLASERSESYNSNINFLNNFIQKINESGSIILVEGKKDKTALERLGLNNVIELNSMPLYKITEFISSTKKDCILLTDLDKEGRKLFGKLNSELQKKGVRVDNSFREFLFKNTRIRQIEGIANLVGEQRKNQFINLY